MTKDEAEPAIRRMCSYWSDETGTPMEARAEPSFQKFLRWVRHNGYGQYLKFRSERGPIADVQDWFDQEFNQMWRR